MVAVAGAGLDGCGEEETEHAINGYRACSGYGETRIGQPRGAGPGPGRASPRAGSSTSSSAGSRSWSRSASRAEADQQGALQLLAGQPYGLVSLWLLGIGFAGYALWRLSEAAFGVTGEGNGAGARLKSLVRAVIYAVLRRI